MDRQFAASVVIRKSIRGKDWPASSPDHNSCDIFLWPYLRSKVFNSFPSILNQLETNNRREVAALEPAMVKRGAWCVRGRAAKCINSNGGYFEKSDNGINLSFCLPGTQQKLR